MPPDIKMSEATQGEDNKNNYFSTYFLGNIKLISLTDLSLSLAMS